MLADQKTAHAVIHNQQKLFNKSYMQYQYITYSSHSHCIGLCEIENNTKHLTISLRTVSFRNLSSKHCMTSGHQMSGIDRVATSFGLAELEEGLGVS